MQIRGNTQIMPGTIDNNQLSATAAIATSKLAEGSELLKRNGSVALTGDLNGGGKKLTNFALATADTDVPNWGQVQATANGLQLKAAVRAASVAGGNVVITTGGLLTIDGVQLVAGDRVLLKDQTLPKENGIYVAAAGAWTRATDADGIPAPNSEVKPGMFCFVTEGTVNNDTGWVLSTNGDITVGTTDLAFVQFSAAGVLTAGAALQKVGNQINVVVKEAIKIDGNALTVQTDGASLAVSAAGLKVADGGVTNAMLAGSIATSKLTDGAELIKRDGSVAFTGDVAVGGHKVTGVAAGTADTDAVNKKQLTDSIAAIDVSSQIAPIQAEIDAIEAGAGLGTDGSYTADQTTNYLQAATSLKDADKLLDAKIKVLETNVGGADVSALQAELDATQTGAGLGADGHYTADATTNYLKTATSLVDADKKLDAQVKTNSDAIAANLAEIDAIETGAGLSGTGAYVADNTTNYIKTATSLFDADKKLDVQVKANTDAIALKASQTEVDAIETGAGLGTDGSYTADATTTYLKTATSLKDADKKLDTALTSHQTEIDAIETGAGLSAAGAYVADNTTNYLKTATSLFDADKKLDAQVKTNTDAIAGKIDKTSINTDGTFTTVSDVDVPSTQAVKTYLAGQVADNAVGFVDYEVPAGTIDGTNATFTLAGVANPPESVHIYINGLRTPVSSVTPGASNTTVVLAAAPSTGDVIASDYRI